MAEPPAGARAEFAIVWGGNVWLAEAERPAEDALATVYAYEPGTFRPLPIAKRAGYGATAAVYRYYVDHLGTPQELTDAARRGGAGRGELRAGVAGRRSTSGSRSGNVIVNYRARDVHSREARVPS